jgi:hypothetical protein
MADCTTLPPPDQQKRFKINEGQQCKSRVAGSYRRVKVGFGPSVSVSATRCIQIMPQCGKQVRAQSELFFACSEVWNSSACKSSNGHSC